MFLPSEYCSKHGNPLGISDPRAWPYLTCPEYSDECHVETLRRKRKQSTRTYTFQSMEFDIEMRGSKHTIKLWNVVHVSTKR